MKPKILILGAGLSGLSTGFFLQERGITPLVFEKSDHPGGLCRSIKQDGFTFDISGHLLHFRNPQNASFVNSLLADNLKKHSRRAFTYNFDKFIPYPFQSNFSYAPDRVYKECLSGFMAAQTNANGSNKPKNFIEWLKSKFGEGIVKHFMKPYNEKFWHLELDELTCDWAMEFIATPTMDEVISGLSEGQKMATGYHASFYYPIHGGISELINSFAKGVDGIKVNKEVVKIGLDKKIVIFRDGSFESFDTIISTIPLPELKNIVSDVPRELQEEFDRLQSVSIFNINLGAKGKVGQDKHWVYFSDKDISFFRVGFYHNFSSCLNPDGTSSLYIDVSYSKNKPLNKNTILKQVKDDLLRVGVISKDNDILTHQVNDIHYGYPICDHNYKQARGRIIDWLNNNSIICSGRYGAWQYVSMEDVIFQGQEIADSVLNELAYA